MRAQQSSPPEPLRHPRLGASRSPVSPVGKDSSPRPAGRRSLLAWSEPGDAAFGADEQRLSPSQTAHLSRLLLNALGGATATASANVDASEGAVSLQVGARFREVDLCLIQPDGRSGLLRCRLTEIDLRFQRRARGVVRVRLSGSPLDVYDLRRGGFHAVGVVGR